MEEIVEFLKGVTQTEIDTPSLLKSLYKPFEFKEEFFLQLPKSEEKKILFVDGGNAELIATPNLSVHFVRIIAVTFKGKERSSTKKIEAYVAAKASNEKDISYETRVFPIKNNFKFPPLTFSSYDQTLKTGENRVQISKIGGVIRRFMEITIATESADDCDLIVLDGNLEAPFTHEDEFFNALYAKQIPVIGLAKTCSLLMNSGDSLIKFILSKAKKNSWIYSPVAKGKHHTINIAKLHNLAHYIFRLDTHGPLKELIGSLLPLCNDAEIPGYPYGLIYVDRLARVTNQEKEYLKIRLSTILDKDLKIAIKALDFHSIL